VRCHDAGRGRGDRADDRQHQRRRAADDDGYEQGKLTWQGTARSYLLRVPPTAGTTPLPLVIALHGAGEAPAVSPRRRASARPATRWA